MEFSAGTLITSFNCSSDDDSGGGNNNQTTDCGTNGVFGSISSNLITDIH
ncbi:MAG: hypothetical protein HRT68_05020 [Flavobacteriaceae bacterium]|nr:hypothetical protein [Flavobacteriaceae bacterium]